MSKFWWLSLTFSCGNPSYLHWKEALLKLYIKPVPVANSFSLDSEILKKKPKETKMQKITYLLAILITLGLEFGVGAKTLEIHNHSLYQKHLESGNFWKSHSNCVLFQNSIEVKKWIWISNFGPITRMLSFADWFIKNKI